MYTIIPEKLEDLSSLVFIRDCPYIMSSAEGGGGGGGGGCAGRGTHV